MSSKPIKIDYFSDILCVWAYVAQVRLEELKNKFQDKIEITPYHVTLFGNTDIRISEGWKDRGRYTGFGQHVLEVCETFPHVEINPDVWKICRPKTSGTSHLFLKAIQCYVESSNDQSNKKDLVKAIEWGIRLAFFRDARDVSNMEVLFDIAQKYSVNKNAVEQYLDNGSAMALFCSEMAMKETYKLEGSPTYLLNEKRQKLFGNVGYKIMEANVAELLCDNSEDQASWC